MNLTAIAALENDAVLATRILLTQTEETVDVLRGVFMLCHLRVGVLRHAIMRVAFEEGCQALHCGVRRCGETAQLLELRVVVGVFVWV